MATTVYCIIVHQIIYGTLHKKVNVSRSQYDYDTTFLEQYDYDTSYYETYLRNYDTIRFILSLLYQEMLGLS